MKQLTMSNRKADMISNGIFLIGIGVLAVLGMWWPGILLVLWAALVTRQILTGRIYDFALTSVLLLGLFIFSLFEFTWPVVIPVLLILGGIIIIFREYCIVEGIEEDPIEETEREIEDESKGSS